MYLKLQGRKTSVARKPDLSWLYIYMSSWWFQPLHTAEQPLAANHDSPLHTAEAPLNND